MIQAGTKFVDNQSRNVVAVKEEVGSCKGCLYLGKKGRCADTNGFGCYDMDKEEYVIFKEDKQNENKI